MNNVVHVAAWVEDVDLSSIDASDLSPSALEKLFETVAPSLQTLIFNIIVALIIYIIGRTYKLFI